MRVSLIGGRAARWTPLKLASMSNSKNVILLNYVLLTILVSCSFNYFSGKISYQNKTSSKQQREADVASNVSGLFVSRISEKILQRIHGTDLS